MNRSQEVERFAVVLTEQCVHTGKEYEPEREHWCKYATLHTRQKFTNSKSDLTYMYLAQKKGKCILQTTTSLNVLAFVDNNLSKFVMPGKCHNDINHISSSYVQHIQISQCPQGSSQANFVLLVERAFSTAANREKRNGHFADSF